MGNYPLAITAAAHLHRYCVFRCTGFLDLGQLNLKLYFCRLEVIVNTFSVDFHSCFISMATLLKRNQLIRRICSGNKIRKNKTLFSREIKTLGLNFGFTPTNKMGLIICQKCQKKMGHCWQYLASFSQIITFNLVSPGLASMTYTNVKSSELQQY